MFFEILKAALFGIVQGITEWLPLSSTGHMILLEEFIHMNVSKDFWDMFLVVIQFGSILAVLLLYFHKLNPFSGTKTPVEKKKTWNLWAKIIVAMLPAAIIGLPLDDLFNTHFYNFISVAIALIVYGIAFIIIENQNKHRQFKINSLDELSFKTALGIGFFQALSIIPGTSRSGSTILGASILGTSRKVAAEFSFFLAVPVMLGASLMKLLKFFIRTGFGFSGTEAAVLIVGMVVAFIVSVFVIKFLMSYIRKHDFKVFGYYRIVLGIIVLIYAALFA
ncbi:undecaprenyl-diphosphate phosphatase [Eubacterium aggregans]|uniref:undecaprenyl-diphosphate phosphatase n=1 Tax=Eubacterium aggregans TaxID=81409 RepID=UPI003F3A20CC